MSYSSPTALRGNGDLPKYSDLSRGQFPFNQTSKTVFFCHVPKTAGTTLNSLLLPHFDERRIWPSSETNSLLYVSDLDQYQFISGHFPYAMIRQALGHEPIALTLVRDPLERYVSNIIHLKTKPSRGNNAERRSAELAVEQLFSQQNEFFARRFRDRQSLFLAAEVQPDTPRNMCIEFEQLVASGKRPSEPEALAALEKFAWVGITERIQESFDLLCFLFGWRPINQVPRLNKASQELRLSEQEREYILQDNRVDTVLYNAALKLHEKQYSQMLKSLRETYQVEIDCSDRSLLVEVLERRYREQFCRNVLPQSIVHFSFDRATHSNAWHRCEFSGIRPFRWTGESSADLDFALVPNQTYQLQIAMPFSVSSDLVESLEIMCNGHPLKVCIELRENGYRIETKIHPEYLEERHSFARLTFRTRAPITVPNDSRPLAVCFSWLSIHPAREIS